LTDLAHLISGMHRDRRDVGVTFRQGTVVAWGPGGNIVTVSGTDLTDLPYLDGVTAATGQVVALLWCANTWLVIGLIVKP